MIAKNYLFEFYINTAKSSVWSGGDLGWLAGFQRAVFCAFRRGLKSVLQLAVMSMIFQMRTESKLAQSNLSESAPSLQQELREGCEPPLFFAVGVLTLKFMIMYLPALLIIPLEGRSWKVCTICYQ